MSGGTVKKNLWCGAGLVLVALAVVGRVDVTAQTGRSAVAAPTFSKDVAPILYKNCVSCHRAGEIGPMSLVTYDEVRPWARAVRDRVNNGQMPPWFAEGDHGRFTNERRLTEQEKATITAWVAGGAPQGDKKLMPPMPQFATGWQIGKPDVVFEMPESFSIPASGTLEYQFYEVPTNFTEDRWIQAAEVRPSDPKHVHHVIVSVIEPTREARPGILQVKPIVPPNLPPAPPRAARPTPTDEEKATAARRGGAITLVPWAAGEEPHVYPVGTAKRIPAGSTLLFSQHYTANGTASSDKTKIGFVFAKEPPQREIRTGQILNTQFVIPPGANDVQVEAEATMTDDAKVWTLHPHMHLRGKDMTYTVIYPDGRSEVVLKVPRYYPDWQTDYYLKEPLVLPKGSKIHVTAHFDNSPGNKYNPNANDTIRWGEQSWEEMMIGWLTYTADHVAPPGARGTGQQQ